MGRWVQCTWAKDFRTHRLGPSAYYHLCSQRPGRPVLTWVIHNDQPRLSQVVYMFVSHLLLTDLREFI